MELYSFFNSSTSYRVRIALALKGLAHEYHGVNIRVLEHRADDYVAKNPSASVPLLIDGGFNLGQSLAIIDYLDNKYPSTARMIPQEIEKRARVLELSNAIAIDIHPINNLRVLKYLTGVMKVTDEQRKAFYNHWIQDGLAAVERLLVAHGSGPYCFGDAPTMADCCLVPQVFNAVRMGCDMSGFPRTMAVFEHCEQQPAFQAAAPSKQPDYNPN